MKYNRIVFSILFLVFISYSQDLHYSSWYKDPRLNRPIIHSVAWTVCAGIVGGLIGYSHAKAVGAWPAYAVVFEVAIGSMIGAGAGFAGGLAYGIIIGQSIHKKNRSVRGISINFEF